MKKKVVLGAAQFRVRDGAHDWEYWHSALYQCLPFVTRIFGKE